MKFFGANEFFSSILISKKCVKMNLRMIRKNHAADPEIGFLTKSISKQYGRATVMPPAWELNEFSRRLFFDSFSFRFASFFQ